MPDFRQSAVVLLATVLAGILLSLAIGQFRQLRLAEPHSRVGHAYWLLLEVGFAAWLFSIAASTFSASKPSATTSVPPRSSVGTSIATPEWLSGAQISVRTSAGQSHSAI